MSVCMSGPCHQPLSARIWELWPAWPIRQCHNISRDNTRRSDRELVTSPDSDHSPRPRSIVTSHYVMSQHVNQDLQKMIASASLTQVSELAIGIKQQDCWNTYIMNEEWMMFMRDMIVCCLAALLASTWSVHYRDHYTSHQNINTPDRDNSTCHWGQ